MSFLTVLEKIGHGIVTVFKNEKPLILEMQAIAAPFEGPLLAQAINVTLTNIFNAEALGLAAGETQSTNATKLAAVVSATAPQIAPILSQLGVQSVTSQQYTDFINHLVAAANVFLTTATAPTTPAPVTGAAVSGK